MTVAHIMVRRNWLVPGGHLLHCNSSICISLHIPVATPGGGWSQYPGKGPEPVGGQRVDLKYGEQGLFIYLIVVLCHILQQFTYTTAARIILGRHLAEARESHDDLMVVDRPSYIGQRVQENSIHRTWTTILLVVKLKENDRFQTPQDQWPIPQCHFWLKSKTWNGFTVLKL